MIENLVSWAAAGESMAAIVSTLRPREWKNIEVRFTIRAIGLGFRCDDRAIGQFCVWVVDKDLEEIAYIEGKNEDGAEPITGFNLGKFSVPHLKAIFHMARCRREMERDRERAIELAEKFAKYRQEVIDLMPTNAA